MPAIPRPREFGLLTTRLNRRAIHGMMLAGGLLTVVAGTGEERAVASATPATPAGPRLRLPSRYELRGDGVELVFYPQANRLEYRDADSTQEFDVGVARDEAMGPTVSALLAAAPDAFVRYLTVLVPDVFQTSDGGSWEPIETIAILTTHEENIGGPAFVKGPLQRYQALALSDTAEFDTE